MKKRARLPSAIEAPAKATAVSETVIAEPLFGIRFNGHKVHFYCGDISNAILKAMESKTPAVVATDFYHFGPFDFLVDTERRIVIETLDKMKHILVEKGAISPRRKSH